MAAGLKTNWILQTHGFDEKTRLVYFDYSQQALDFKKLLHEEWNGEDYPEFLRYLFTKIKPGEAFYQLWGGFSPQDMAWDTVREAWTREISRWGGEAVIKEHWRRAKQLRVDYVLCNILEDQEPIAPQLDNRAELGDLVEQRIFHLLQQLVSHDRRSGVRSTNGSFAI